MPSPAYLSPAACRRRYEVAVEREHTYSTRALDALADRLLAAANAAAGDLAAALRDRGRDLAAMVARRERLAEHERVGDERDRAECERADARDAEREWDGRR